MSNLLKTPSFKKKNPLRSFQKDGSGLARTAPNTPEEEDHGVTIVANEIDPSADPVSALVQMGGASPPSPLRGDHRSYSSAREEKKEEPQGASTKATSTALATTGDEDVVSKTLRFLDDMCAVPPIPPSPRDVLGAAVGAPGTGRSQILARPYTGRAGSSHHNDDTTATPSMRSKSTSVSSARSDPSSSRYSTSAGPSSAPSSQPTAMVKNHIERKLASERASGSIPRSPSHDHENFEVVLDPSSLLEEVAVPDKPTKAKRWPRLSKTLSATLSAQKKDKKQQQQQQQKVSPGETKSPKPEMPSTESEGPLDEEIGRLIGAIEKDRKLAAAPEEGPSEGAAEHQHAEQRSSAGPKVLAKKIWKQAKKIPGSVRHGDSKKQQQQHRLEVDNDAAVAHRSAKESKARLESQEFLKQESPRHGVEPILEENENEDEEEEEVDRENATGTATDATEQATSMAEAWNNIFSHITSTLDPESLEAGGCADAANSMLHTSGESSEPTQAERPDPQEERLRNEEALATAGQSVEVSHGQKKAPTSRAALLGQRLKKIQKSAYFKTHKKKNRTKAKAGAAATPRQAQPSGGASTASDSRAGAEDIPGMPAPPKMIWKSVVDPRTGRTYYYHRKTRETTWFKPEAMKQYERDYKEWLATVAGEGASNEAAGAPVATTASGDARGEKEVPSVARSSSWPKAEGGAATADENSVDSIVKRTSSNPLNGCGIIPVRIPEAGEDTPGGEAEAGPGAEAGEATEPVANEGRSGSEAENAEHPEAGKAEASPGKASPDDSKPFDEGTPFDEEPAPAPEASKKNEPGLLFLPRSPKRFSRTTTYMSKASARSALTDRTEKIKNTGKGRFSGINAISETMSSATSISSLPSRVPVVRERQLMVEELTDARISAESYEGTSGERRGRIVKGRARHSGPSGSPPLPRPHHPPPHYDADEDTGDERGGATSAFDNETYGTDSVSALSENDTDFLSRRDNFDQARRRALDAAIEVEDWDLAAALSDGMRAANLPGGYEKAHTSWNQSELDKFIATNDWDAVKAYIAKMRRASASANANARKKVGSRSRIQHREAASESSWSGSDSGSSYETYDTESQI